MTVHRQGINDIQFKENNIWDIFHGIKYDPEARVTIHYATNSKDCINRKIVQSTIGAVFLTRNKLFKAMCASTVSNILSKSVSMVSLTRLQPKDFRCTVAAAAVVAGFIVQNILKVGKWKNPDVFRKHV